MLWRVLSAALRPRSSATALVQRAFDLRNGGDYAGAERVLREAAGRFPGDAMVATNLAAALLEQDQGQEAIALLEKAIAIDPRGATAHFNYAYLLRLAGRHGEAIAHYRTASELQSGSGFALEELLNTLLEVCAWDEAASIANELRERAGRFPDERSVTPLMAVYLGLNRDECKRIAGRAAPASVAAGTHSHARVSRPQGDRIRIGYFSRDFRDHPVGHVLRGVFALHDRSRFETHAFSCGLDDASEYRKAIEASVDSFVDVARHSDDEAARAIREARIDILVDLMGHTVGSRLGVLARRPAPVQAHWLGYPGTTGAPYIDYFVSDEIVTPQRLQADFTEELAYVPECFMASDGALASGVSRSTRAAEKLPESGYVFANFGSPSRVTRETFALWMRILDAVPGSVLWLRRAQSLVAENLQREAQAAGVDAQRLVFAERLADKSGHLGRLRLADLALDTLGWYNGHSSSADMLWAGVPVLTAPGNTFPSRVAASLASAAGLNEWIAQDPEDYVAMAVRLGRDPAASAALRARFEAARASAPFFDTARLVRGLETAYESMFAAKIAPAGL